MKRRLQMKEEVRRYYLSTSTYTNPGPYGDYFRTLPNDIPALGRLVCDQLIHPTVLLFPSANLERYFGPLTAWPSDRVMDEDELFVTAPAMTAEIFRLDPRGFVSGKAAPARLAVTCRHAAVLMASICKAKGIPCRCRAGFIDFLHNGSRHGDHWINQIWNEAEQRWMNMDVDGYYNYEQRFGFSQYDLPNANYSFSPAVWLGIRNGSLDGSQYVYQDAAGTCGLQAALIYLFLDLHALMNQEVFYSFRPKYLHNRFVRLTEAELSEIDNLAHLMLDPDQNFPALKSLWENNPKFRILTSPFNEDF